jgi:hypothetical protein
LGWIIFRRLGDPSFNILKIGSDSEMADEVVQGKAIDATARQVVL